MNARSLLLTVVAALVAIMPALAEGSGWVSVGPSPPAVEAPIAMHIPSQTVYLGSFGGGVLKSTDGGATFAAVNDGLGNTAVSSMAMDPVDPNNVVVGTIAGGIYRTSDGGGRWAITSEATGTITFLAVDPLNPQIYYAGYMGGPILKKSSDGGRTWANSNAGIASSSVWSIVPDRQNSGVVYAATAGAGAFKSVNGGGSWTAMPLPSVVWSLAVDPANSQVIYAGVNGDGVFRSSDGGATFIRAGSPDVGVVLSLAVDPTSPERVYAATASGGVELSEDSGAKWKKTTLTAGIAIAVTIAPDGQVFVGTAFNGAFASIPSASGNGKHIRYRDGHFTAIAAGELRAVNAQNIVNIILDPHDSAHLLLGTNDGGILASFDAGNEWRDVGSGFLSRSSRRPVFDPNISGRVYAGSFNGGGLYRSDDNGHTWTRHVVGSSVAYVWSAGVDPHSGAVYAGTQNGEGLWRSVDEAGTFARIDGTQIPSVRDIVFDATTAGRIFVAALNGLFRSVDGGTTFTRVATGAVNTVTMDPADPNTIYAGTQTAGVLKSVDGGTTFVAKNIGLTIAFSTSRGNGVAIDPRNRSTLYIGTEGAGVFKSMDGGESWLAINDGLSNLRVFALALDPAQPDILYAGGAYGVFKTTSGGQ